MAKKTFNPDKIVRGNYHVFIAQWKFIKQYANEKSKELGRKVSESEVVRNILAKGIIELE